MDPTDPDPVMPSENAVRRDPTCLPDPPPRGPAPPANGAARCVPRSRPVRCGRRRRPLPGCGSLPAPVPARAGSVRVRGDVSSARETMRVMSMAFMAGSAYEKQRIGPFLHFSGSMIAIANHLPTRPPSVPWPDSFGSTCGCWDARGMMSCGEVWKVSTASRQETPASCGNGTS